MERLKGNIWPIGHIAPNGYPIDQDMIDGGDCLYKAVRSHITTEDDRLYIEHEVTMHGLVHEGNDGRLDVAVVSFKNQRIDLFDYKYGHRYVEVFENWALIDYMAGIIEGCELSKEEFLEWSVNMHIVQPRWFGHNAQVRTWSLSGHKFWPYMTQLSDAAVEANEPIARTKTGNHCYKCPAVSICPAMRLFVGELLDFAEEDTPEEITVQEAARELRDITKALERLEARKLGLEPIVQSALEANQTVPHWTLERSSGRESWAVPNDQVLSLGKMFGLDLSKPGLLTPKQVRQLGLDESVIKHYAKHTPGAVKLKLLNHIDAAKAFS
jgi:hypothetical protein